MTESLQVDPARAEQVLGEIDELRDWCEDTIGKLDKGFVRLASLLSEVRANRYYLNRGYESEEDYLKATFPQSRASYYDLLKIGNQLCPIYPRKLLEDVGRTKCTELIKIQNKCGSIEEQWWLHAKSDTRDVFKRRVSDFLAKRNNGEPEVETHFMTLCIYGDDIIVVNKAMDVMSRILGTAKGKSSDWFVKVCYEFLSGFDEDGQGRVMGQNSYLLWCIGKFIEQLNYEEPGIGDRLVGTVAGGVERARAVAKV